MRLPISVTGTSTLNSLPDLENHQRVVSIGTTKGFTLFEILVVVVIVTISVSAILLNTSFVGGSNDLKVLGNDLGKTIRLLYQEAIFENKNYAISIDQQGFKVLEYDGEAWVESNQRFFRKVKFNESQQSSLVIENQLVEPVDESDLVPHILILSSGEMTPFEWEIRDSDARASITLFGDFLGNVLTNDPVPHS
jgi:general secretion pathway protein H